MYINRVAVFLFVFLHILEGDDVTLLNTWMDFICLKCSAKVLPPSPTNFICHGNKIDSSSQLSCLLSHCYKKRWWGLRECIATCV